MKINDLQEGLETATPTVGDRQHVPTDQAAPELLPNLAGFVGTNEQFLNALGVIASRSGADGTIAAVALEQLARRAHLSAHSAPAEAEELVRDCINADAFLSDFDTFTKERSALTRSATALTALQAKNERVIKAAQAVLRDKLDELEAQIGRECRDRDVPIEYRKLMWALARLDQRKGEG